MLGKLMKYEFRATGRVFLPMYAVLLVMSVLARIFYSGRFGAFSDQHFGVLLLRIAVTLLMVMLFTAVAVVTLALILRRFGRNLLGREGYLMNVLPVSPWQHVTGKLIVSGIWFLLSILAGTLAMAIMLSAVPGLDFKIGWAEMWRSLREGWSFFRAEGASFRVVILLAELILLVLSRVALFILSVYAAMCLGQLANRHRVWLGVGCWIGINTLISIVQSVYFVAAFGSGGERLFGDDRVWTTLSALTQANIQLGLFLLISLCFCALLFFVTGRILQKRLNLQ